MPVISTRRFSSTSSASSYSPNTIGSYRASSLTSDRFNSTGTTGKISSTIQTSGTLTSDSYLNRSSYRTNLINTAYRTTSGLDDKRSTTPTSSSTSTSRYGVSKYTKTSVDRDLPPSGSKYYNITQRLDNTNKRDNLNKIDNLNTKNTNTKASTPGLDLYEKYSPSNYIPKCELSRSRSLIETSNKILDKEKKDYSSSINGLTGTSIQPTVTSPTTNKVRNASTIRSGLPPTSTLSSSSSNRYWERDRERDHYRPVATSSESYSLSRNSPLSSSTLGLDTATSSTSTPISYNRSSSPVERIEGLCGLRNIGNTCFMNSVLQCLSHTSELTKFLKNYNTNTYARSPTKDQRILIEFAKLIKEMWQQNQRSVTPMDLKQAFSSKYRIYSGCTQQDAQEFLRFFLDTLHTALNTGTKGEYLNIDDDLSDNNKADLTWNWYSKTENSVVKDLFVGQLKSSLRCTVCGNTSVTFDPFWDLSLPLPSSTRCKLENCLELFIKEEVMDGDEMPTCAKCKTRRKCTKTFTIQRFPRYLVIHLKRFSETRWSKLTNIVEFPTGERELNLAPYASNSSTSAVYTLYGISNHMGSTAGGHYVALCKHPDARRWHGFNDNTVSETSESGLVSSSAYLLFYERV